MQAPTTPPIILKAHQLIEPAKAVQAIQQGRACAYSCPTPCAVGVAKKARS